MDLILHPTDLHLPKALVGWQFPSDSPARSTYLDLKERAKKCLKVRTVDYSRLLELSDAIESTKHLRHAVTMPVLATLIEYIRIHLLSDNLSVVYNAVCVKKEGTQEN